MAHYRMIQVSEKPLTKDDIEDFEIHEGDLTYFFPDYWGDEDRGDALECLQEIFGGSILKHTKKYIVIDREELGIMLMREFEAWRTAVCNMSFEDATDVESYKAMRPTRYLSVGHAIYEDGWNGCGEHTWDYLTNMYHYRFKEKKTGKEKKTFRLYYGASIDFHV